MKNISVKMVRPHLQDIPQFPCPHSYRIRAFGPGEGGLWTRIQQAAEPFLTIDDGLFKREFSRDFKAMEDRSFFLETTTGKAIGTITAWWDPQRQGGNWGQIHWVAIHPDYHGKGLSKPMMTAAMNRLQRSHDRAFLGTSSGRLAALKVYLDFGFVPDMDSANAAEAWSEVAAVLKHPALQIRPG